MTKRFLYHQSIVQFRIPIEEDGTPGVPEVVNRFTTVWNNTKVAEKKKVEKPSLSFGDFEDSDPVESL